MGFQYTKYIALVEKVYNICIELVSLIGVLTGITFASKIVKYV